MNKSKVHEKNLRKYVCVYIGDVYLLGGTNGGKISLFNSLIDSDQGCQIQILEIRSFF